MILNKLIINISLDLDDIFMHYGTALSLKDTCDAAVVCLEMLCRQSRRVSAVICVRVASPEGVWWAETIQTHKTLSHNATEWSSLSCLENILNSMAWPAPLQTTPDRQRQRLDWAFTQIYAFIFRQECQNEELTTFWEYPTSWTLLRAELTSCML